RAGAMIAALAAAIVLGLWAVGAPRLWRGAADDVDDPPPAWPFGAVSWHGVIRRFIVCPPLIGLALGGAALAELTDADDLGMSLGVIGLLGSVVLHVPILLWNRPKALVPPPLRDQP